MSSFLCLLPTGAALEALRAHPRPEADQVRWEPERRWHLTLRYTPHHDERTVAMLAEVADEVAAEFACPEVALGPVPDRLGRDGTLVVPAQGIDGIAAAVETALDGVLGAPSHPFVGHLTLARLRGRGEVPAELLGVAIAASFTAPELVLIESTPGADGSNYSVLHRATFVG
jgi:2'-5' RNA ligase